MQWGEGCGVRRRSFCNGRDDLRTLVTSLVACFIIAGCGGASTDTEHESTLQFDTPYYRTKVSIFQEIQHDTGGICMLGDSMTDYCDWVQLLDRCDVCNQGISGDVISGVTARIDHVVARKPRTIFLMIGINDLARGRDITQFEDDYDTLVTRLRRELPVSRLVLQSLLPVREPVLVDNTLIRAANGHIEQLALRHGCTYVDIYTHQVTSEGSLGEEYTHDGLHLNAAGYQIWKKAIAHLVE